MHISTVAKPAKPDATQQSGEREWARRLRLDSGGGYVYNSLIWMADIMRSGDDNG
nr:hypothetical protein [Providencia rettgeri]